MRVVRGRKTAGLVAIGVLLAAAVVGLTACTSGSTSASSPDPGNAGGEVAAVATGVAAPEAERNLLDAPADSASAAAANSAAGAGDAAAAADQPVPAPGQPVGSPNQLATVPVDGTQVIKTGDLSIKLVVEPVTATDDKQADREANAAARAAAVAQAGGSARGIAVTAGGFQSSADGGGSVMSLSLRVPADQYDAVVDKLAALGEVTNRTETSQDVTAQVADVNSRVESMTASVARVRALLAAATDIADVISIESELAVREANLESLQQQQAALSGQVALSTISLTLTAVTKDVASTEPIDQDNGFVTGLKSGWAAMIGFLGGVAAALGAVLPFLPLLAAAGLLVWWLIRRARRRAGPVPVDQAGSATSPEPIAEPEPQEPVGVGSG